MLWKQRLDFSSFFDRFFTQNRCKIVSQIEKSARSDKNQQKNGPGEPKFAPRRDFGQFSSPGRGLKMAPVAQKGGNGKNNYEICGVVFGEKARFGQFSLFLQFLYRFGAKFWRFRTKNWRKIDSRMSFCTPAAHTTPYIPSPTLQIKRAGGGSGSAGSIRPPSGPGRARPSACSPPFHTMPYQQCHAMRP